MTKKFFAILLALVLTLSLSAVAFAAVSQDAAPIVPKTYTINSGTAPAETFTFTFEGVSYKDGDGNVSNVGDNFSIPAINPVTISFDAINTTGNKTTTASVNANNYNLGVYTYKVTETAGNTAGVTYSNENLYLVLTVLRDETNGKHYFAAMHYQDASGTDKTSGFTNAYDSGSLAVTKKISGNMADMDKEFNFTVVFTAPTGKTVKSEISTTAGMTVDSPTYNNGGSAAGWTTATYTFKLGHDDTMTFSNLPAGVTYTVSENKENYTQKNEVYSDATKTISAGDEDTYEVTNELTNVVDTGITMDSIPYIVLLALAVVGIAAVTMKKRYEA